MSSSRLEYKGYTGSLMIGLSSGLLYGRVENIDDAVCFQGKTVTEVRQSFVCAVEDYLGTCTEIGKQPQDPAQMTLEEQMHKVHECILYHIGVDFSEDYVMFFIDKEYSSVDVNQAQLFLEIGLPIVSTTEEYVLCRRVSSEQT